MGEVEPAAKVSEEGWKLLERRILARDMYVAVDLPRLETDPGVAGSEVGELPSV